MVVVKSVLRKLLYTTGIRRPDFPQEVGMVYYQKKSSWELKPDVCSCDLDFCEYLKQSGIENKSIFHFGTGQHHIVGLENQKLNCPNEIIGITASILEHQAYVQLIMKNAALAKYYKVLFGNIYTLTASVLPMLDVVTLFHLCEFYLPENAPFLHQNDESLLQLFIDKLHPKGKILFFSNSLNWATAKQIVQTFEQVGKIKQVDRYKNLLVYAKNCGI